MEDAALIRFLDGQMDVRERREVDAHLAACFVCQDKLGAFERLSRGFHAALQRADTPVSVPAFAAMGRGNRPTLRRPREVFSRRYAIAAGVGIVMLLAAAPPVRAAVGSLIERIMGDIRPSPTESAAVKRAEPALTHSLIEFEPSGSELVVDFDAAARRSALMLGTHAQSTVMLLTTAGSTDEVTVLPSGLRVARWGGGEKTYRLVVPAGIGSITIRVGGKPVFVSRGNDLHSGDRRIELLESG